MSSKENPCRKFQANIFNKSKCQNCFKPRESHSLSDEDLNQAKPIYGGWLLLAPEGTNFDNPLHRSRKWQRRFFILYEHGLLRYALDEMPSTLPQGTINMNQCSDVIDGEARTGQKFSLCILTPEKEHFIRAENKEIISGWLESLVVYPRTNKQNLKKKRKVEPPTPQGGISDSGWQTPGIINGHLEPGPAKVTVTSSGGGSGASVPCLPSSIASVEKVPASRASLWQEERRGQAAIPCSRSTSCLSQLGQGNTQARATRDDQGSLCGGRKARVESGYFSLEKAKPDPQSPQPPRQLSLPSPSGPGAPQRYSSSDTDPLTSPHCPSPDSSGDPFPSPGHIYSNGSSTISSSQSSLDSEASSPTPASALRWEGRSIGGTGRVGRATREYVSLADVPRAKRLSHQEAFRSEKKWLERRARTRSPGREEVERLFGHERRRSQVIEKFETFEGDSVEQMETSSSSEPPSSSSASAAIPRQGRSERRHLPVKPEFSLDSAKEQSMPDVSSSSIASYRRAKSLDRRATESSMTPDLLNFKKGWMTKLYEDGLWKKHWFVLTDQSLRYYRDSVAEEAADLDGEIDLSTCYDVTEFPVQRNYGFQIHQTKEGAFTLSAMTSGIRRNWIQAIMKNVRPTIAPDVTRSLPEERAKVQASLDLGHEPPVELCPSPDASLGQGEALTRSSATSELRRSRIRERRREGRSKTFDWAEFCHGQPVQKESSDRQPLKGVENVDISSASSSNSSPASSPVSSASSGSSSVPLADPPLEGELERDRTRRREERRRRVLNTQSSMPVTPAATVGRDARAPDDTDAGRMEVERSLSMPEVCSEGGSELGKPANVQVEIEQRWHQVETTPLREEKQVPIATIHSSDPTAERLPPQELAALLDKELEQAQKELTKLQEQNKQLQEQLQAARGRELSAREGYVLQCDSPTPSPHTGGWHRLHKLNQDLQTDLEAQRRKQDLTSQQVQALKRNYSEAKDVIRHHEAQIQALQTKLNNALAEILISEQAVAKMRSELKLEQERFRERKEEWEHNELTLRAQLKDSEDRLKDVEAHLLEKSQALRDLERQQALQRDHLKEVQKLQERLTEVTGRLIAAEEVHALKEERLQKNLFVLQESQEKERQGLVKNLAEAELRAQELEDRLQEAEQQVETLLLENQSSGLESSEVVHQLEEQLAIKTEAIGKLTETVRQLEEEKGRLTCRCQELLNQIAEADNEVNKLQARLKTEETNYYNLEHSYEKVSEEFQKIHKVLREKEEEIRETKEMYERLVLKKEQDLNEALIKMVALGSSLEETEMKLQAKEELICKLGQGDMGTGDAMKDLQAKLVVAEDRIAELEQHLNDLQLGYSDLQMEHCKLQDNCDVLESMSKQDKLSAAIEVPPEFADVQPKSKTYPDGVGSPSKRQRIRFSNIHCQKYMHTDGGEKMWAGSNSLDLSQDQSFSEESGPLYTQYGHVTSVSSDPEKFISIIHTLETKLFATEEKLKDITLKLEEQQTRQLEAMMEQHCELAKSETDLQEQLNESLSKVDQLTAQLRVEMDKRSAFTQETNCRLRTVNSKYEKALACVESSREKVQAILREPVEDSLEAQLRMLSEIETELVNATMYIREGGHTLEEHLEIQVGQKQEIEDRVTEEEKIKLFAKTLAFEALVLNKMAFSIQNPNIHLLQSLNEIHLEAEKLKRSDEGYIAVEYADVLTRKLMIESEFWTEVEKLETQFKVSEGRRQSDTDSVGVSVVSDESIALISNACIKSELNFAVENLKHFYEEKLQKLKGDVAEVHIKLQQRELALKEIVEASNRADSAIQEVNDELGFSQQMTDSIPPELDPFIERIKVEEVSDLSKEIVSRHLQDTVPSCCIDDLESLRMGRDRLVAELLRQSNILQYLSQEVEATCKVESSTSLGRVVEIFSVHPFYRNRIDVTSGTLCMREAMIQAQIAYVACKLRADHERELKLCREACQSMDVLCQEHARNIATIREQYEASLLEQHQNFNQTVASLQEENGVLQREITRHITELSQQQERLAQLEAHYCREMEHLKTRYEQELNQAEQGRATTELALMEKTADSQRKLEVILMDIEKMEDRHEEHVQKLEDKFHGKMQELQRIHEEEMQQLHSHYTQTIHAMEEALERLKARNPKDVSLPEEVSPATDHTWPMEQDTSEVSKAERDSMMLLRDRIQELETQMNTMKDELENKHLEGDLSSLKEKYQKDFENLKATCERGFAAMEETHQKVIEDIQRQHQREVTKLLEERERLLAEETAATIAAIEAMKNAHREEMEKTQRSQLGSMSADIDELRQQYEEELRSIHRELEVLSEQYSQKCLENAHLAQALEAERQALQQCQRENQELNAHNQELNNRLAVEITRMRSCIAGDMAESPFTQGKDLYELEVLLRVKESEIQYLKQEIHSLKDELQSALRDKKYTADKYKDIYMELSIVKAKADCDISKLKEQLMAATEALGERSTDGATAVAGYDIMKSKSNPDFLKERSSLSRQIRGVRSKSLKEGLTVQERLKLFEAKDSRKI
ncbi:myosin phosphatase Rho-interacting protein isoform X2 [Scleropages formosus]|uniref:myosin phosphatase Rho-interacting protein isoform X2 n=1 Tax=Scleropages formosus TaxID=113540 RepID=UPI0010FA6F11|nr:plectin-like isoform X2 [Scleropages formosus]